MKKIIIAALFMLGISTMSFAQTSQDSTHHRNHKKGMYKALNLTKDQKDKLHQYNKDTKTKADAIKNDQSLSADQKKTQLKSLREENKKNISGVLTDEQKQKMKDMKQHHKKHSPAKTTTSPNTGNS